VVKKPRKVVRRPPKKAAPPDAPSSPLGARNPEEAREVEEEEEEEEEEGEEEDDGSASSEASSSLRQVRKRKRSVSHLESSTFKCPPELIHSGVHQGDVDSLVGFIEAGIEVPGGISNTSLVFVSGPALLLPALMQRVTAHHPNAPRHTLPLTSCSLRKTLFREAVGSTKKPLAVEEHRPSGHVRYLEIAPASMAALCESDILLRLAKWIPYAPDSYSGHTVIVAQVVNDGEPEDAPHTYPMHPQVASAFARECLCMHLRMRRPPQSMLWGFVEACVRHHLNMPPGGVVVDTFFNLHSGNSFPSVEEWISQTCYRLKMKNA
jgi:hypothetical protein